MSVMPWNLSDIQTLSCSWELVPNFLISPLFWNTVLGRVFGHCFRIEKLIWLGRIKEDLVLKLPEEWIIYTLLPLRCYTEISNRKFLTPKLTCFNLDLDSMSWLMMDSDLKSLILVGLDSRLKTWLEKLELINGWLLKSSPVKNIQKRLMFSPSVSFFGKLLPENLHIEVRPPPRPLKLF